MTTATPDVNEIRKALDLFVEPGGVVEIRALSVSTAADRYPHTESGYFSDLDAAASAAARITPYAKGVYFTPNPVNPALLARAKNRLRTCKKDDPTTSDHDVTRRRWLLVDVDPERPAGISANDVEHAAALALAEEIREALSTEGWPAPILGDSGNGGHLAYRIDLPNDDGSCALVERTIRALAFRFDQPGIRIDQKTFNAARIWKLYGTIAAKGDSTDDRPHRIARLMEGLG